MDRAAVARAQWKREVPGLELEPMVLLGRLAEAAHLAMTAKLEPVFAANGLTRGEFDVLATLRRAGPPYALTPTELYRATMVSSGGMTARIDRLEKAGLIARKPHPEDRRALMVALTPKGRKKMDAMLPGYVESQAEAVSALTKAERKALSASLEKLIAALSPED